MGVDEGPECGCRGHQYHPRCHCHGGIKWHLGAGAVTMCVPAQELQRQPDTPVASAETSPTWAGGGTGPLGSRGAIARPPASGRSVGPAQRAPAPGFALCGRPARSPAGDWRWTLLALGSVCGVLVRHDVRARDSRIPAGRESRLPRGRAGPAGQLQAHPCSATSPEAASCPPAPAPEAAGHMTYVGCLRHPSPEGGANQDTGSPLEPTPSLWSHLEWNSP